MGHNDHDNERPVEGSIPMPPDRDRMGRKRSWWGRPLNASPLAPDLTTDEPYIDLTPKPKPHHLIPDPAERSSIPRIIPGAQIIGTSRMNEDPIYRCLAKLGDNQCGHTSVDPDRMERHILGTIHWANRPNEETHRCSYREGNGRRCLFTGPRPEVVEHLVLVKGGEGSHFFEPLVVEAPPKPKATSPGVDPLSVDEALTRRTNELIRQTQKELLRVIERADEPNINSGERTWRLNRVNELTNKLQALMLIAKTPHRRPGLDDGDLTG